MVSSGGYFPQGAAVGLSDRGASAPAAFEMVSDMGAFVLAALEMVSDMGASAPVAPTVNHFGGAFVPGAAVGKFSARFSLLLAGV